MSPTPNSSEQDRDENNSVDASEVNLLTDFENDYTDTHNAETLADFGVDLTLSGEEALLVPTAELHEYFDKQALVKLAVTDSAIPNAGIRIVGVGPAHGALNYKGNESVFVEVFGIGTHNHEGGEYKMLNSPAVTIRTNRETIEEITAKHDRLEEANGPLFYNSA